MPRLRLVTNRSTVPGNEKIKFEGFEFDFIKWIYSVGILVSLR